MVAQNLVVAWEDAYRKYGHAVENDVTETSRAVAGAWRELAACVELPWWLSAAVRSAAQAFEHQAEAWNGQDGEADLTAVGTEEEDAEEEGDDEEEHEDYSRVTLPIQQGVRKSCACAHTPPVTGLPVARATA